MIRAVRPSLQHGGALREGVSPDQRYTLALGTRSHPPHSMAVWLGSRGAAAFVFFKTPEMPTKKGSGRVLAYSVSTGIPPAAGAAQQECNNGERQKAGAKNNRRTNKSEIRHEGWEGVPVCIAEAFRQIASLGGIVEELLHRTS